MIIILPQIDRDFMENLMRRVVGRTDQPVPEQATIDAYLSLASVTSVLSSNSRNIHNQVRFADGKEVVFRSVTSGSPFDAAYRKVETIATVYKQEHFFGTLVHIKPDVGDGRWATSLDQERITEISPFLDAFRVYLWLQMYQIPRAVTEDEGHTQLYLATQAAFPFYDVIAKNTPTSEGLRLIELPKITGTEHPVLYVAIQ